MFSSRHSNGKQQRRYMRRYIEHNSPEDALRRTGCKHMFATLKRRGCIQVGWNAAEVLKNAAAESGEKRARINEMIPGW